MAASPHNGISVMMFKLKRSVHHVMRSHCMASLCHNGLLHCYINLYFIRTNCTFFSIPFFYCYLYVDWVSGECVCVHLQGMRVRMAPGQHDKVDM